MSIARLARFAPGAAALANDNREWLRDDLRAGISVAAVAVPIAIAYSQLAVVPPVFGLYASILPLCHESIPVMDSSGAATLEELRSPARQMESCTAIEQMECSTN